MLNRPAAFLTVLMILIPTWVRAQAQPSQEQQDLQDQMRQNFQTIMQNMQAKGINPGDFFQQMRQGADPADIQKQLIDQGIIDAQFAAQMQSTAQKLTTLRFRDQLQCTDAEWEVLDPLLQRVLAAATAVGGPGGGGPGGPGGMFTTARSPAAADLSKAKKALHAAIEDTSTPSDQFTTLLRDVRDARSRAQKELTAARRDLVAVLTVRQEAILSAMGILE